MSFEKTQQNLDLCKYFSSQKEKIDLSGAMNYCQLCASNIDGVCHANQYQRQTYQICEKEAQYMVVGREVAADKDLLKRRKNA